MSRSGPSPTSRSHRAQTGTVSTWIGTAVPDTLVDTDVLIDHFRGHRKLDGAGYAISVVTRCELFAGRNAEEDSLRKTLALFDEVDVSRQVAERAGQIRRAHGIATPDALIAATALEHGMAIMTRNVRHFERVPGLSVRTTAQT
ncbi:MAG TPA: type II toxin-antitoxin system VapC family toxin [Solirubrobacteraceae bacterium]|nr:type II toxin-antitoxin system VapC family toxin [Solirubrobacteraceae bacterium]